MKLSTHLLRVAIACSALTAGSLHAQGHSHAAHQHGKVSVDIAIEREQLTLQLDTPLDNLLGFERAPRTAAERHAAQAAVATLRAADGWLRIDPRAGCKLADVALESAALGLGDTAGATGAGEHAELEASYTFRCTDTTQAASLELGLADAFKRIRSVEVQIVGPKGQVKRTLSGKSRRIDLPR